MTPQSELFEGQAPPPLARRMTPRSLDEFVGQEHLLGPGKPLRMLIEKDVVTSLILWGPPGCGKSALAGIIASRTKSELVRFNAVTSTVDDIRQARKEAQGRRAMGKRTILFMDEIHRFNKAQQDALLPDVEEGTFILVGTTTHNPFFAITGALISRSRIFSFSPLSEESLVTLLKRALADAERGLGGRGIAVDDDAFKAIASASEGDARTALNTLELASFTTRGKAGKIRITCEAVSEAIQNKHLRYDRDEDEHYNIISAFIKSMRGSDPDAAIYWLARMIAGGEDPRFIARRMMIFASEDVGNADPRALLMAAAALQAVEHVGLPEAQINLAHVVAYLACAPKSNASYMAIAGAMKDVEKEPLKEVPIHLKDANYPGAKTLGHQKDYKYPHNFPGGVVEQSYMPDPKVYYQPTDRGAEAKLKEYLGQIRKRRAEH